MPDLRRRRCRVCGRTTDEVGELSWTGNCSDCWPLLLRENMDGIRDRTGYAHKRRLRGYAKWLARQGLDAEQAKP